MLIAALLIGAITAYYFGLRLGAFAAVGATALFFLGILMPGQIVWTYGVVGAYTVGVLFIGPRMPGRKEKRADFLRLVRRGAAVILRLYRRLRRS